MIEVTTDKKILINVDHIIRVEPAKDGKGCWLTMLGAKDQWKDSHSNTTTFKVEESYEVLKALLM